MPRNRATKLGSGLGATREWEGPQFRNFAFQSLGSPQMAHNETADAEPASTIWFPGSATDTTEILLPCPV